ncbi:hypothetical protein PENSPDRAFT_445747 [Peniophora sp. CONT]|nr:hypothetical protein PENSPDRAFT_445747 [Peniophora sp. CONT]
MSADAIAQLKAFSWDDKRPPKLPERQNLDNALPSLLKAATGTLSVDLVHRELAATHSNFKAAAAALAFILHEYGSDNETEDNRLVDLTELKDRIIAAQEKHQVTNLTAKNLMYPLAVALFVSPIFLFNKVQLVKNVLPFEELFETWKLLGNENRPEALSRIERDIWKLLLRVLDGADLMACLLSYLEYWKVIAPDFESKFEEARTWFKPGHLPANMRGTARQGNKGTTSQANVATSSDSGEQANSCIDPQLLTDHAVTHNAAGPSNEAARNGVHGVKRPYAEAQAQAESSKKPRLSVSTSPTPGDRSVETGSNISPLAGRTTPTPSQDDDGLYFTEDPPFLPLNESPAPSTAQTADSVPTAAEDISNRPSSETLLASALAEVNRLRSERDALQAEHEPLKTEHKALKTEAAKLRSDRDTLSERLSGLSGRLATTQNLVERAEGRERALGAELASVRLRKEKALALEATLAESNARADSAEDHVRQLKAEREDLLVKLRASESAVATARSEAQRISAERHAHVEDVTGKLEGVSANIAILTKAVEAWRIQSQQIAAERDLLLQGMRELLPAEAGPTSADSSDVLRSVAAEMERLREQVLDADQRASNADQRAATAEQERASMEDAHDRRAAHITVLQRRIAELESNSWKF